MKLVIQRVNKARVGVGGKMLSEIGKGLFVLIGIHMHDTMEQADILAEKLVKLRVMPDKDDKMNLAVGDLNASILVVPQFTLYADTKGANRPSFSNAASPEIAQPIYEHFVDKIRGGSGINVQTGQFGEHMDIHAELDGPVTIIIES